MSWGAGRSPPNLETGKSYRTLPDSDCGTLFPCTVTDWFMLLCRSCSSCAPMQLLQAQAQPPAQHGQPPAPNPAAQQLAAQQQATWAVVCATGREQQLESKRLAKCILVYVAEHREEVAPLFDLFSVYLVGEAIGVLMHGQPVMICKLGMGTTLTGEDGLLSLYLLSV